MPGRLLLAFRSDPLGFLSRLAKDYGDVAHFRIGGMEYWLLNDPELIHEVLVKEAHRFTKGPALQRAKTTLGEGLLTSEGEFHRRQRRLAQPVFHAQRVAVYAPAMVEHARRTRERWAEGTRLDLHQEMMRLTLTIVADALFGDDIEQHVREISEAMTVNVQMFTRALMPWGALLNRLPLKSNRRYLEARQRLFDTIQRMVERRRAEGEHRNDFLSLLLRAHDAEGDGGGMSDEQLRDEAITIFTAGHETTANALAFTGYLLAKHPDIQARWHAEVDQVLGQRLATAEDLPKLPYTRACLAEAMRLYPPAWTIGRRAKEECPIGEYVMPAGTVVLMSQWVMHHDERYWPEPMKFDPGRWLGEQRGGRPKFAYFPFGGGARQCIGEPMAWLEGVLVLATLGQRWWLELAENREPKLEPTITLRPKGGIGVVVREKRNWVGKSGIGEVGNRDGDQNWGGAL